MSAVIVVAKRPMPKELVLLMEILRVSFSWDI
jgi:hypothetical protein